MTVGPTPGPWLYVPSNEHRGPYVRTTANGCYGDICDCYVMCKSKPHPHQGDRADANARLIAAAPALVETLREIRWIVDGQEDITDNDAPNDAMKIQMLIDAALARAGVTT